MAAGAIITDVFKKKILLELDSDIQSNGNFYIGIGRAFQWDGSENVPTPANHRFDLREATYALQSIKTAEDRTFTVPRNTWSSGTVYDAYDDRVAGYPTNAYYVINSANNVYICLEASKNSEGVTQISTVEPTDVDITKPFKTSDGYVWKFLYGITALNANKFLSANFIPVNFQKTSSGDATLQQQKDIQDNSTAGQLSNIVVTDGGTGYSAGSPPTITIQGNGSGATATATVSESGAVTKITLDSSADSCRKFGINYDKASVLISGGGGSGAKARPVLAPRNGHGADARDDLRATKMMFNTKPSGAESLAFNIGQDFRQIMLLRNPHGADSSSLFTDTVARANRNIKMTGAIDFPVDTLITGGTSGAKAYVDQRDSSVIHIHQSDSTGYQAFAAGETITGASLTATIASAGSALGPAASREGGMGTNNIFPDKFDIYYLENRAPVIRSAAQTEDIKVVISI